MKKKIKKTRRKFTVEFKTKVAIEAIKDRETLAELSQKYEVHSTQIAKWKKDFLLNATAVFYRKLNKDSISEDKLNELYATIGRLEVEKKFLKKKLNQNYL